MDHYTGKRAIDGVILSRKGSGHVFTDASNNRDRNPQLCNRLGCNGKVNSPKGAQTCCSQKGKSPRPSIGSSTSGKEVIGTSPKTYGGSSVARKSLTVERKMLYSHLESDSFETCSERNGPEVLEIIPPPENFQRGLPAESKKVESSNAMVVGASDSSKARSCWNFNGRAGLQSQDAVAGSSISFGCRTNGHFTIVGSNKSGLKNCRCNSTSDAIPPGCSSSESNLIRRRDTIKKRNSEGESSCTSRGKKIIGSASEAKISSTRNGISISETRRSRNTPQNRCNAVTSARTRRTNNSHTRPRISSLGNESSVSPSDTSLLISPISDSDDLKSSALSLHISSDASTGHPISFSRPGSSSERICTIMPTSSGEVSITHSLVNQDNIRRFNMDGIAEVLLALERIKQDEELTREEMLVLETNLFLNSLAFYDQHRDLRLDIDSMSYEELLALEERMGTVSTALTEEELAASLKKGMYQASPSYDVTEGCDGNDDEIKCSICQWVYVFGYNYMREEYMVGDEVGNLLCEHRYHTVCIKQWLRFKNWCPICKASAAPSKSVLPS